jgi:hypothetical protein
MPPSREQRVPSRYVPLVYFAAAHLSLLAAFAVIALAPRSVLGFYYTPRMLLVVHLVTVGWITSSILGALYLIGPMALRTAMPTDETDRRIASLYVIGGAGIVLSFLAQASWGVGLSGLIVLLCVGWVGRKLLPSLLATSGQAAPAPGVKLHFVLAFANFGLAAATGALIAFDRVLDLLPGYRLAHVAAHAHLAFLGWATMMVMAAGYRLLPMFLPSQMPSGARLIASGLIYETGVIVLFVSLLAQAEAWTRAGAVLTVLGIAAFFAHVAWMKRHPRTPARGLPRPDLGAVQALLAIGYLGVSAGLGLYVVFEPGVFEPVVFEPRAFHPAPRGGTEATLRLTMIYGVTGLLGFLAQMIAGISTRLLPIFAWMTAFTTGPDGVRVPPEKTPHELVHRPAQVASFVLWVAGVPALAAGLYLEHVALTSAAGTGLFLAVAAAAAGHYVAFRSTR